jgi:hypothetical protein
MELQDADGRRVTGESDHHPQSGARCRLLVEDEARHQIEREGNHRTDQDEGVRSV